MIEITQLDYAHAMKEYTELLHKPVGELTEHECGMAFMALVMERGQKKIDEGIFPGLVMVTDA